MTWHWILRQSKLIKDTRKKKNSKSKNDQSQSSIHAIAFLLFFSLSSYSRFANDCSLITSLVIHEPKFHKESFFIFIFILGFAQTFSLRNNGLTIRFSKVKAESRRCTTAPRPTIRPSDTTHPRALGQLVVLQGHDRLFLSLLIWLGLGYWFAQKYTWIWSRI